MHSGCSVKQSISCVLNLISIFIHSTTKPSFFLFYVSAQTSNIADCKGIQKGCRWFDERQCSSFTIMREVAWSSARWTPDREVLVPVFERSFELLSRALSHPLLFKVPAIYLGNSLEFYRPRGIELQTPPGEWSYNIPHCSMSR